ncbi:MAG TPA: hemin uptake protein HemP [Methylophilaceae bacterium]|nr:hemin uptake protein HemP [Methylophilaceae bacterium]
MNKPITAITDSLLAAGNKPTTDRPLRRWDSRELFGEAKELVISHAGSEYRLRLTSQGKLILTK